MRKEESRKLEERKERCTKWSSIAVWLRTTVQSHSMVTARKTAMGE